MISVASCTPEAEAPLQPEDIAQLTESELLDHVDQEFSFTPNQNFEALYYCLRRNSLLAWYFQSHQAGTFDVLFTTDTHENFSFPGTYTFTNDVITLQMKGGPNMPFPNELNESSLLIMSQWGLVVDLPPTKWPVCAWAMP